MSTGFRFASRRPTEVMLSTAAARSVRETRVARGWTQAHLAERAEVSRTLVSKVECGRRPVSIASVAAIADALGSLVQLTIKSPLLVRSSTIHDSVHARCCAYAQRRLERAGWLVTREVPIGSGGTRGWIDLLAFHPGSGAVLVIEIKTEIDDLGRIERTLGWYEREAVRAAREHGWTPRAVSSALLAIDSLAVAEALAGARITVGRAFPVGATTLAAWIADPTTGVPPRRALALIDPMLRRADWLIGPRSGGRTRPPAYRDYAHAASRLGGRAHPAPRPGAARGAATRDVSEMR